MKTNCDCTLCRLALRLDIEQAFERERRWLGIYQVRARIDRGWTEWGLFFSVWLEMIHLGILIVSFAADADQFPRYILARLTLPARCRKGGGA